MVDLLRQVVRRGLLLCLIRSYRRHFIRFKGMIQNMKAQYCILVWLSLSTAFAFGGCGDSDEPVGDTIQTLADGSEVIVGAERAIFRGKLPEGDSDKVLGEGRVNLATDAAKVSSTAGGGTVGKDDNGDEQTGFEIGLIHDGKGQSDVDCAAIEEATSVDAQLQQLSGAFHWVSASQEADNDKYLTLEWDQAKSIDGVAFDTIPEAGGCGIQPARNLSGCTLQYRNEPGDWVAVAAKQSTQGHDNDWTVDFEETVETTGIRCVGPVAGNSDDTEEDAQPKNPIVFEWLIFEAPPIVDTESGLEKDIEMAFAGRDEHLRVFNRNVYVGADLSNIASVPYDQLPQIAKGALVAMQATNIEERMAAIADEIEMSAPDVLALQEMAIVYTQSPSDLLTDATLETSEKGGTFHVDFLVELQKKLEKKGLVYHVVATSENADVEISIGDSILEIDMDVRLIDHDIILVRDGIETVSDDTSGNSNFEHFVSIVPDVDLLELLSNLASELPDVKIDALLAAFPGVLDAFPKVEKVLAEIEDVSLEQVVSVLIGVLKSFSEEELDVFNSTVAKLLTVDIDRGWASVVIKFGGKSVRIVNTHLDPQDPAVRLLQAEELVVELKDEKRPLLLVGDINSNVLAEEAPAYAHFLGTGLFSDLWLEGERLDHLGNGATCCHLSDLSNETSSMDERIDVAMARNFNELDVAIITTGHRSSEKTASGLWPSDHAGLLFTIRP